ncbi:MAG: alanine-glyoxylate transaminase / serine-glyoxylate transaminase / serine-pyruvate transaminase [Bacillota bacterium]|nr:alanine-glyoxylate transaminase / serine-glyoxylate transaminase / serine-pyruvate transaminase [Bacillota bacterium]MDK2924707.1 alanine-glyoxylate transaminase / serine-glyoxylate transaminase / serine-pyruvate transaminase [Bacillota bacterium]
MLTLKKQYRELAPSERLLLGPGPSGVDPRVLRAMSTPLLGHLDPEFLEIMNETGELLRYVFQTENRLTLAMSGTGSAGMDTILSNLLEPGDKAIIAVCGVFGERMVDIALRNGAEVKVVQGEWGRIIDPEAVEAAFREVPQAKLLAVVHAETSTGILQPLTDLAAIAHRYGALLVVDCVTSLGGVPVLIDEWGVDAAYSGTQKCLSCPPGLAPVTLNEKARTVLHQRKTKVPSWYLDLTMIERYWGQERFYHHTAPISMIYALREALRVVAEEGLEARWARHELNARAFLAGCEAMGLRPFAQEGHRLPSLITLRIPEGVEDAAVRQFLLREYKIEIGGGLGPVKGQIWRVGLMGYNSNRLNVTLALTALAEALKAQGYNKASAAAALEAADAVYAGHK